MVRVFIADNTTTERLALRLLLKDLEMEVVGEATDWSATLAQLSTCQAEMLLVDWNLLPYSANLALEELRAACPAPLVIVLLSQPSIGKQAALSSGADMFISKSETPQRVLESLQMAARKTPHQ